jgi:hypothetical protein
VKALLAAALALGASAAPACTAVIEGGRTLEGARHVLAYRPDPARVALGEPFALDIVVCPKDPGAGIAELRVDAHMPEHRHGMNYKASVRPLAGAGRYRAEGLMFHMPGRWEFLFDVVDAGGRERLKQDHPLK